jgi:zinc and cadmium transporter
MLYLYIFCIAIIIASLLGGAVPLFFKPTHRRMQLAGSFIGGVMAGIATLDLLPEALGYGEMRSVMLYALAGFVVIFLLERFLPSHCHEVSEDSCSDTCGHEHKLTWIGAFVGLSIHSLFAGIALAAAWSAGGLPVALGVFIAIVAHKPFDGLTLVAIMRMAKINNSKSLLVNIIFSLSVPLGVLLFQFWGEVNANVIAATLAFSAGMFLCISLCDLLPELQFHGHDRIGLTVALILGLAIAWGISSLHSHDEGHIHESNSVILHEH